MQKEAQKIMSPGLDRRVNPQSEDAVGLICHPKVVVGGGEDVLPILGSLALPGPESMHEDERPL